MANCYAELCDIKISRQHIRSLQFHGGMYHLRINAAQERKEPGCALCENIHSALAANKDPASCKSNLVCDLGSHIIIPNRFPRFPGHSLFLATQHNQQTDLRSNCFGPLLSQRSLVAAMQISDRLNLGWMRNHPRGGMSIPEHDHFHMYPIPLVQKSGVETLLKDLKPIAQNVNITTRGPFSNLIVS